MTDTSNQLRQLYKSSEQARRLIDLIGLRSKGYTLEVDIFEKKSGLPRQEVISLFKNLDQIGVGRFVVGRRGQTSRFEANQTLMSIASVARGEATDLPEIDEAELESPPEFTQEPPRLEEELFHVFIMRASPLVKIQIPFDISSSEADGLINFVKSLPTS